MFDNIQFNVNGHLFGISKSGSVKIVKDGVLLYTGSLEDILEKILRRVR